MRQVVCAWESDGSRLYILWDNDRRDSMMSIPFDNKEDMFKHISGLTNGWKIDGFDVEIHKVNVHNPKDNHWEWTIDYDPKGEQNAIVFTLL